MPSREVHIQSEFNAPAAEVWAIVRNFCGHWHPAIATIAAEQGGSVRCFTMKGEDTVYREQLTSFNETDRNYSYRHLDGIRDIESYEASITITELNFAHCRMNWRASIIAVEPRAREIAAGTEQIFQMGLDALREIIPHTEYVSGNPKIALAVAGKSTDILCLFLHGIGGGKQNWSRQLQIAAHFMKAAAMDLRGYGESALGFAPSTIEDYCNDILRAMKQCGANRLVLCGLSYGSWIATSFAMRHPEKLVGLILTGGCTGMSEASADERDRFRIAREVPLNEGKTPRDFAPAVIKLIASPQASENVRQELFQSMAEIPAATYRDALQCFTTPKEQFRFSKLNMPILFVTGELDKFASPIEIGEVANRVRTAAQNSKVHFEVIAGAGHVCNIEAPSAYNSLLQTFLRELAP